MAKTLTDNLKIIIIWAAIKGFPSVSEPTSKDSRSSNMKCRKDIESAPHCSSRASASASQNKMPSTVQSTASFLLGPSRRQDDSSIPRPRTVPVGRLGRDPDRASTRMGPWDRRKSPSGGTSRYPCRQCRIPPSTHGRGRGGCWGGVGLGGGWLGSL